MKTQFSTVNVFDGFCRGDGPVGAGGDHLAQGRVANVPRGEDAWDGGLHKLVRHDEAALIELDLALYQLRPRSSTFSARFTRSTRVAAARN